MRIDCWRFDLDGDTLRLCWPRDFGQYPESMDDQRHGVCTCCREGGKLPVCRTVADVSSVTHPVFGTPSLAADGKLWTARFEFNARWITVHFADFPLDEVLVGTLRASWALACEPTIRAHAVAALLTRPRWAPSART